MDERAVTYNQLAEKILNLARTSAYFKMRFLSNALTFLRAYPGGDSIGVDGQYIYYNPEYVVDYYKEDRRYFDYAFLHMAIHCMFLHIFPPKGVEP